MGQRDSSIAIVPKNPHEPIAFITYQFVYYYTQSDHAPASHIEPYLITGPQADHAAPPATFPNRPGTAITPREQHRRDLIADIPDFYTSAQDAVTKALTAHNLQHSRLGYDSLTAATLLTKAAPLATGQDARDVLKNARLIKTPHEIALMRTASAANVKAALLTAQKMRELGSIKSVRREFFQQVSALGNTPVFMAVDGIINENHDEALQDGTSVLIDCVSHHGHYHGDYGRTIFIGDPPPRIRAAVTAISTAIQDLNQHLRPGLKFSQIPALGQSLLAKHGDYKVPFGPHAVGLAHTDQPSTNLQGQPLDITLEPGMILSIDCPLMEADIGGTVHMEDLILITPTGAEPIHDTSVRTLSV